MNAREFKDAVYNEFAKVGKVLSSPKRMELIDLLSQSPKSVELLARETKMTVANTSKHLQVLLDANLVMFKKDKNFVIYQLTSNKVAELLFAVKSVAETQIPEINALRNDFIVRAESVETVTLEDWMKRRDILDYILIDVRPKVEYQNGHIENALSIPIDELHEHLSNLPRDKEIVAYCRGAYCVYSTEAVELLQSQGYRAYRLEAGVYEWQHYQK